MGDSPEVVMMGLGDAEPGFADGVLEAVGDVVGIVHVSGVAGGVR